MLTDCIFCSVDHRDRAHADEMLRLDHAGIGREPLDVIARRLNVSVEQLNRHKVCLGLDAPPTSAAAEQREAR
jgi:hypothetical protein